MLSLSELPLSEGEPGSQINIQGWVKERDNLLATVESLKRLITQMQIQREAQVQRKRKGLHKFVENVSLWSQKGLDLIFPLWCNKKKSLTPCVYFLQTSGSEDWRAELLDAVRQVFVKERSVLKSALYSQLDLLDTSDAIIHLNQLESRLAEQVRIRSVIRHFLIILY